jgi:3D (Asp-Asp-Asp) domain-containing protein
MFRLSFLLFLSLFAASCAHRPHFAVPSREPDRMLTMEVTGYCECGTCCNWKRSWLRLGTPVVASGPDKGKVKKVGQTASGLQAQVGTVAADTRFYPMGTIVYVPDYGWGRVEDRGGAIKGQKLDLFFNSHKDALHWGRKKRIVQVWLPRQ